MVNRFCSVAKLGAYCESVTHSTERRKDGEVKTLQLGLRVEPFDAKLATAVHQAIRNTLFTQSKAEAHDHLRRVAFAIGVERQLLTVFATPDTVEPSIAFDHVKITDVYARASKDARTFVLHFKAVFGPPGAKELEYCEFWRNSMAFVTFTEAEPAADFEEAEPDEDEEEETDQQPLLPQHEFDTESDGRPLEAGAGDSPATVDAKRGADTARQKIHSHAAGRKRRAAHTPEVH